MNAFASPPTPAGDPSPDDLDRLLGAFFRAEVPSPWPRPKALAAVPAAPARRARTLRQSRLALAASVAALLVGGWYLSARRPSVPVPDGATRDGAATVPAELRRSGNVPMPPVGRNR